MAQLICIWQKMAHSCHFKIIVIPTSHPMAFHLSILQKDKRLFSAEWEWAESYSRFMPEPLRVEHHWENSRPTLEFASHLLAPETDSFSCSKHQSYIFLEAAAFTVENKSYGDFTTFMMKKGLQKLNIRMHIINMHNHNLNLVFSLGGKEFPVDSFFQCTSII